MDRPSSPLRSLSLPHNLPTFLSTTTNTSTSTLTGGTTATTIITSPTPSSPSSTPFTTPSISPSPASPLPPPASFPILLRRSNSSSSTLSLTSSKPFQRVFPQKLAGQQKHNGPLVVDTVPKGFNDVPKEFRDVQVRYGSGPLDGDAPMPGFSHGNLEEDGTTIVLKGRDWILPRCEAEPIRSPGAVQSFGVLFAFELDSNDNIIVGQVSENSTQLLGLSPSLIFSTPCLTHLFPPSGADSIRDALEALHDGESEECLPPGFDLVGYGSPGTGPLGGTTRLEWSGFASVRKLEVGTIIMEVEPHRSFKELEGARYLSSDRKLVVEELKEGEVLDQDIVESTTSLARPLKELVRMRARRKKIIEREEILLNEALQEARLKTEERGEVWVEPKSKEDVKRALVVLEDKKGVFGDRRMESKSGNGEPDVVQLLTQCEAELRRTSDLIPFLKIAATLFKDITEFDRAMIYRFDEDWNGEILAEQIDWSRTQTRYRGLHFPETDIPCQARELYAISPLRLLADREAEVSRMCCRSLEEVTRPLNMSHCVLRALSPMCHKFLKNMGIRSTMSISIMVEERLWGLVILQHHGDRSHRVSFPTQHICRLLGESVGRHIARLSMQALVASRAWATLAPQIDSETGIMGSAEDILSLFRAQFGVLSLNEESKTIGSVDDSREIMAVVEYLRRKRYSATQSTRAITEDFTDINYPAGFNTISGFIVMPLSREGRDFIVFFRARHTTDITWAGNPEKLRSGVNSLDPRETFEPYAATTSAKCDSWADELGGIPQALIVIFGRYIDIWRRKESLLSARRLAHSLLIDASAAVRGPLNGIIHGLEEAITSAMDEETRQHILSSHTASLTLTHVINELLDLTKTEQGQTLHSNEPFDVGKIIRQALVVYSAEASVRGIVVSVLEPLVPTLILLGDAPKLQRIISNVMSNAIQHTQGGQITIQWRIHVVKEEAALLKEGEIAPPKKPIPAPVNGDITWIEIFIEDTGSGIPPEKLDGMFRFFEHVSGLAEYEIKESPAGKTPEVGLGLAQVARIVQTLHGTMSVASHVGEGSKFIFRLPFETIVPSTPTTEKTQIDLGTPNDTKSNESIVVEPTGDSKKEREKEGEGEKEEGKEG